MRRRSLAPLGGLAQTNVLFLIFLLAAALLLSACGSGDADEPRSPGAPAVQIPRPANVPGVPSVPATASTASTTPDTPSGSTPVGQRDACNISSLNTGRFLGTGLQVVAIVDEAQCPICASGESCTTSDGRCRCLVLEPG